MMDDPGLRSLRARVAAHTRAAMYDGAEVTAAARARFMQGFLNAVDLAAPGLPEAERQRRAASLRRAHFARLAYKSAAARRGRPHTKNAQPLRPGRALVEVAGASATACP